MATVLVRLLVFSLLLVVQPGGVMLGYSPAAPVRVKNLLCARPFTLQSGYQSDWHKDSPPITAGYIVVLSIDASLRAPRAGSVRVLLAADSTVEEFNFGHVTGILVGVVPGAIDLTEAMFWFGPLGFADELTVGDVAACKADATAAGMVPFSPATIASALAAGGTPLVLENRSALLGEVSNLIGQYQAGK